MTSVLKHAMEQFQWCCIQQPRYRVAWLTGMPLSGKTYLARQIAAQCGWHYLDYTLTPGYFDTLTTTIATYHPENFLQALQSWIHTCPAPVLIVDELDALLATWSNDQRRVWASKVSRMTALPCGVLLVSHLLDCSTLSTVCLPDTDSRYCMDLAGEML